MQRRDFLQSVSAGLGIAALGSPPGANAFHHKPSPPVLAARLQPGITVGLIAPASRGLDPEDMLFAQDVVTSLGFEVKLGQHLFDRWGYFAGTDEARAADLNAMFTDPKVDAIFCARGGYGASRLLPLLDYTSIARNPKILLGYSDITALHLAINRLTGLITFHGPIATQTFSDYTLAAFQQTLMQVPRFQILAGPVKTDLIPGQIERHQRLRTLRGGKAEGHLIGGNLSLITHLLGSPYAPHFQGAILFIEDVDEAPYRVDRMLTALSLNGVFDQITGLVIGNFSHSRPFAPSFSMSEVMTNQVKNLKIPVLKGLMIGHIKDQATLPIGARVSLDADRQQLTVQGDYLV